jgi:hypothetical protein
MASPVLKPAEVQFHTSSIYPVPQGWSGPIFKIKNDYPTVPPPVVKSNSQSIPALPLPDISGNASAPWLNFDFKTQPLKYAACVLGYCWEGNKPVDFVVQKNTVRSWYHAPWMHAGANGREPLRGLTYERPIPPLEFASTQTSGLQNWAIGFYNPAGAVTFGKAWQDPNKPVWNDDLKFLPGTGVFKFLLTTATDKQVPTMKGSPEWKAVISPQLKSDTAPETGAVRNTTASTVRLLQVDWATVDHRSPIGWVFGTFLYDCTLTEVSDPWYRLTAVGVQWGNDPNLNQAAVDAGKKPEESWINPRAEELRKMLGGKRPSWGYNGRLNGPVDNFVSACASCHSTAQSIIAPMAQSGTFLNNKWIPENERLTMTWFQNIKAGEPFSNRGAYSADNSLQFVIGWTNYKKWEKTQKAQNEERDPERKILSALPGKKVVFRAQPEEKKDEVLSRIMVEEKPLRAGPTLKWV